MQKTQDSNLLYRGWLGHYGTYYNTNTCPSFLITLTSFLKTWPNFSNSRSSFWFLLSLQKLRVQMFQKFGELFGEENFENLVTPKSIINFFKYNLIVSNLHFTKSSWSYFVRQSSSFIPIGCISYLFKIPNFWFNN